MEDLLPLGLKGKLVEELEKFLVTEEILMAFRGLRDFI
jgi:hypothetical protein